MNVSRKTLVRASLVGILAIVLPGLMILVPGCKSSDADQEGDYTCSMHPHIRKSKPGRCPICGMELKPVEELSKEQALIRDRAGVLVEPIAYRELAKEIRTVGKVDYNEGQTAFITARMAGRVDKVYADFTGIPVKKKDHLVDIYSADLYLGQGELIRALDAVAAAKKAGSDTSFLESTVEAARTKLALLGVLPEQIRDIEKSKKIQTHLTIFSPIGGTVIDKNVRAGQYVKEGDVLYRIANLDPIWLYLDIYEFDLFWVRYGQAVEVTVEAYSGKKFQGRVVFIDPFLDDKTRTVRARVNLPNPDPNKRLRPAMYATAAISVKLRSDGTPEATGLEGKYICPMHPEVVRDKSGRCDICEMDLEKVPALKSLSPIKGAKGHESHDPSKGEPEGQGPPPGKVLAIPASAVLDTGRRKITYRQTEKGAFELVELQLGPRADGTDAQGQKTSYFPVLAGLKEKDRVVVRGGFLLDSQRQIEGMPSLLYPKGQSAANLHSGHGGPPPKTEGKPAHKH